MVLLTPSDTVRAATNTTTGNAPGIAGQLQGLTDGISANPILVLVVVAAIAFIVTVLFLFTQQRRALLSNQRRDSAASASAPALANVQSFVPPLRAEDTVDLETVKRPESSDFEALAAPLLWVASDSDMGLSRDHNEDALLVDVETGLLLVADGVGGSQAGEIASSLAAEFIGHYVKQHVQDMSPKDVLLEAVLDANRRIHERAAENPKWTGMGSTIVAALCSSRTLYVVHEGDSRAYLTTCSAIQRITRDNTVVEELIEKGLLTPDEARFHPERHVVTKSLGTPQPFEPELNFVSWGTGEYLLLCSDGLTDMVDDFAIKAIVTDPEKTLEAKCESLIDAANQRGGVDNITVVLAYHS
jgi:PPM family protein phosphatase